MKKQILALALVVSLAACTNNGSSTIGERDEDYGRSFEKHKVDAKDEQHASPADHTQAETKADTTHAETHMDSTHH